MITIVGMILTVYMKLCDFNYCKLVEVDPAAVAISSCESGDGYNFGTVDWNAESQTGDTGAFQFNDATWQWLTGTTERAKDAPQYIQLQMFYKLWDSGYGWRHWSSSKSCWSQWLEINKEGRAVWKKELFITSQLTGAHHVEDSHQYFSQCHKSMSVM